MPVSRLRDVWTTVSRQAGASYVNHSSARGDADDRQRHRGHRRSVREGGAHVMLSFDPENKIAGMNITPRTPPAVTSCCAGVNRFTEESVAVGAGEWALPGTLSMPVGPVAAAIVLVHGSGPSDRDQTLGPNKPFRDLAWGLADRGIAVLRYEKRTRQYAGKMAGNRTLRSAKKPPKMRSWPRPCCGRTIASIPNASSSWVIALAEHWLRGSPPRTGRSPG